MLIVNSGGSPRSYWALEDQTDYRNEYIGGQIISRMGTCARHSEIVRNVGVELRHRERGRGWSMLVGIRVKVESSGAYVWPDITVYEKPGLFESRRGEADESLLDAILIMEVFSPLTETFVRDTKRAHYQRMPSLS